MCGGNPELRSGRRAIPWGGGGSWCMCMGMAWSRGGGDCCCSCCMLGDTFWPWPIILPSPWPNGFPLSFITMSSIGFDSWSVCSMFWLPYCICLVQNIISGIIRPQRYLRRRLKSQKPKHEIIFQLWKLLNNYFLLFQNLYFFNKHFL